MKKKFLAVMVVIGLCVPGQMVLAEERIASLSAEEVCDLIQENPDNYGGYYFGGFEKELHIVPLEESSRNAIPFFFEETEDHYEIIYDEPAKYSLSDLKEGFLILRESRDALDLTSYATSSRSNGLRVSALEWTEEKKEFIKELTGIDNIEFIVSTEFCPSEVFIDENVNIDDYVNTEEIEERVVAWAQFGNKIENFGQDGGTILGASTLGAVAEYKDDSDSVLYITTGHGMEEGDQIYLVDSDGYGDNGAGKLGEVVDVSIGTDMDIALIEQTNDSTVVPINEKRDGTEIYDAGNAIEGHVGEISSWQNQPVIGFDEVWADVSWNDPDHNDVGWYENLLQLHTVTGATESGDSGSPVFMYEFSDEDGTVINQILVGIYKGRGRDGYLYATRWDTVEDYYDVEMKVFQ